MEQELQLQGSAFSRADLLDFAASVWPLAQDDPARRSEGSRLSLVPITGASATGLSGEAGLATTPAAMAERPKPAPVPPGIVPDQADDYSAVFSGGDRAQVEVRLSPPRKTPVVMETDPLTALGMSAEGPSSGDPTWAE